MSLHAESPGRAPTAAVIGLGSMGFGMAQSMKRDGLEVVGYDITPAAAERFAAEGGRAAATLREAVHDADVVVSVVVNAAQTEAVLFGADGVAAAMKPGAVFVSSATMDPAIARRLSSRSRRLASITSTRRFPAAPRAPQRAN